MLNSLPFDLSVILPTRDRPAELRLCLAALAKARVTHMECIVVDDGSAVTVADILKSSDLPTVLIRNERSVGSGAARNIGAAAARGRILLFVDDDVCVGEGALKAVVAAFEGDPGLGGLIGRYDDAPASPGFLSQYRNLLHAYTHRVSAGAASTFWTGFGAVRTSVFREHRGFTERARAIDDVEFGARVTRAGVRIELRPELQVKHLKRWTMRSMLKTDLLLRGMPWTLLIWHNRKLPNTLNLRWSGRCSVVLACAGVMLAAAALFGSLPWVVPTLSAAIVLLLNLKFYEYLRKLRGNRFALLGVAAHWLYLWVAGLSFFLGTILFFARQLLHVFTSKSMARSEAFAGAPSGLQDSVAKRSEALPLAETG